MHVKKKVRGVLLFADFTYFRGSQTEKFVKNVYESELKGPNRRGRPLGRWLDRVAEYLGERGINP